MLSVTIAGLSYAASVMAEVSAAATVASAGMAAYESHVQGVQQANADQQKARAASIQATQQQITMRQNMLRALASQNAGTLGAIGAGGASSFAANARRQISQAQNDLLVSNANASAQISLLDQNASEASATGAVNGAIDLAGGIAKAAPMFASASQMKGSRA